MRLSTPTLKAFLDGWNPSTNVQMADLYTFSLITGENFRYTDFQSPLQAPPPNSSGPNVFFGVGPRFNRSKTKVQVGPEIDELQVEMFVGPNDELGFNSGGNLTWQAAFHAGLFDGAYCELQRAFIQGPVTVYSPPNVVGTITWFYGRVADIEIGRTRSIVKVKSLLDLLTIQMPRRLWQSACSFTFGEPGFGMCGYDRVNGLNALGVATGVGAQTITCLNNSSQFTIVTSFVPAFAGSYNNGSIIGLTGLNAGYTRTIGALNPVPNSVDNGIYFLKPWIFPVVAGVDTFTLLPGCDHTLATCTGVFQNQLRFGGQPSIPPPETSI